MRCTSSSEQLDARYGVFGEQGDLVSMELDKAAMEVMRDLSSSRSDNSGNGESPPRDDLALEKGRSRNAGEALSSEDDDRGFFDQEPSQRKAQATGPTKKRETKRSVRLNGQFANLAALVDDGAKSCKASILAGVSGYLEQLQLHNATLESDQCEIVSKIVSIAAGAFVDDEKHEQVDYKLLFLQSTTPMAVASLDGKLLSCNERLVTALGADSQAAILKRTIFDLAQPARLPHLFSCISDLLRSTDDAPNVDIANALRGSNATLSITLLRPSSFAVSLVDAVESHDLEAAAAPVGAVVAAAAAADTAAETPAAETAPAEPADTTTTTETTGPRLVNKTTGGAASLNGHTNGHINGHLNGHLNGHINGHINGHRNSASAGGAGWHQTTPSPPTPTPPPQPPAPNDDQGDDRRAQRIIG